MMLAALATIVVVLARRKSPAEVGRQRLLWADAALAAGKYEQAITFYKRALAKDPTLWSAYFNLALAYEYTDDEKALAAWEEYLKRARGVPSQAEWLDAAREHRGRLKGKPHYTRAAELAAAAKYKEARKEYDAALAYSPASLDTLKGAAANEAAGGNYEEAVVFYKRALAVAPYSMNIRYDLALVYENYDKAKAAATWAELLEMATTHTGIKMEKLEEARRRLTALRREGYHG